MEHKGWKVVRKLGEGGQGESPSFSVPNEQASRIERFSRSSPRLKNHPQSIKTTSNVTSLQVVSLTRYTSIRVTRRRTIWVR